jgi:MATE family multidrug resistance protein
VILSFFQKYKPYYINNLKVALPVMLSQAGQVTVQIADNVMVGHYGATELAAASFANSIYIVGFVLSMGITFGLTPLVGAAFGQKNYRKASSFLFHAFIMNMLFTFLLLVVMWIVSFFMQSMGQPENVAVLAVPYYRILLVGLIPSVLFFTFKQFVEGLGNTRIAMVITLGANLVNIGLNYILIYGKAGFPELGLAGAGYATFISRIFMAIGIIWLVSAKPNFNRYLKLVNIRKFQKLHFHDVFKTGFPIGLQMLAEVTLFSLAAIMVGWFGEIELAAHQIALSVSVVSFMIATGISSGTTIRVSHQLGAGKMLDMKRAGLASGHLVVAFMGFCAINFFLFREYIPYLFIGAEHPEILALASKLLVFSAIFQIFDGTQVVMLGALRGLSDVKKAFWMALLAYMIIGLPTAYLLGFTFEFGVEGVWAGLSLSLAVAASLFFYRFWKMANRLVERGI